jgi:eukaryotic-like serine/threonine-protein kinase
MQRDLAVGRLVGRYMVHRRIAAGGMATVHLGRLLGAAGFSRTVAIKRLHDGYARDPDFVAMLLDEARLASTIRHPNVVQTLDVVAVEDELLVVMDYVEGDSLAHLVKLVEASGSRVPVGIAAAILSQALHGLHAAHEARDKNGLALGIVHRDVSPQNILVGIDGVGRVLDFGIAKAVSRATSTEDGQLKGKTAYMAPEQLQLGSVDRRTDVFAAAVVLWEVITGRRLFLGHTPAETMSRVQSAPIDSPLRWAPELPPELAAITLRGLERDPNARFATAEEMALAIEDAIALPRAKEIGAFVTRVASATIEARAALVRELENALVSDPMESTAGPILRAALVEAERRREASEQETSVGPAASGSAFLSAPAISRPVAWDVSSSSRRQGFVRGVPPARTGPGIPDDLTDLASVSWADLVAPRRPSRKPLVMGIVAGLALASAIVIVFVVVRVRETPARAIPPPPIVTLSPADPLTPPAADPVATPPPVPAAERVGPTTSIPVTGSRKRPTPPASPNRPAAGQPDCRIPYVVDAKGLKHFKVECL